MLRGAILSSLCMCAIAACTDGGGSEPGPVDAAPNAIDATSAPCDAIDGRAFRSVGEHECGLTPDGVVYCHWEIEFAAGTFDWYYSDVGESGTYTCDDMMMIRGTTSAGGDEYTGSYEAATGQLTWDGLAYEPAP